MTTAELVLRTLSVRETLIVTGAGPQANVITPPFVTAAARAADVQLAGVPRPTTRVGFEVSAARPAAGTVTVPLRFPGRGSVRSAGFFEGFGAGVAVTDGVAPGVAEAAADGVPAAAAPLVARTSA